MKARAKHHIQGFTLIELIIIVIIIGILAAVAIPQFSNLILAAKVAKTQGYLGAMRDAVQMKVGSRIAQGETNEEIDNDLCPPGLYDHTNWDNCLVTNELSYSPIFIRLSRH